MKIRWTGGPREVPGLGRPKDGGFYDVNKEMADSLISQGLAMPADGEAQVTPLLDIKPYIEGLSLRVLRILAKRLVAIDETVLSAKDNSQEELAEELLEAIEAGKTVELTAAVREFAETAVGGKDGEK